MSQPEHIDLTQDLLKEEEKVFDDEDLEETPSIEMERKEPPKLKRRLSGSYDTYAHRLEMQLKREEAEKHYVFLETTQRYTHKTPAAVYKFDAEIFGYFNITATIDLVRSMKSRFMSKRIRELADLKAMSWSSLSELVDEEWEQVDRDLRAGHIIFAFWKMMCYCGRSDEFK
jgi:hypothetical protein